MHWETPIGQSASNAVLNYYSAIKSRTIHLSKRLWTKYLFFGFKLYIYVQAEIEDGKKYIKVLCILRVRERGYTFKRTLLHVCIMAEKSEKHFAKRLHPIDVKSPRESFVKYHSSSIGVLLVYELLIIE